MTYVWIFDDDTGELWTGVDDGRARALLLIPPADGDAPGLADRPPAAIGAGLGRDRGHGDGGRGNH